MGVGQGANNPPNIKMYLVTKHSYRKPRTWTNILVQPKQWKGDMRFGTSNVRSLYRAASLTAAAWELARYKLDLVDVQEVRWDKGSTVREGIIIFSMENEIKIINWEKDILYITE